MFSGLDPPQVGSVLPKFFAITLLAYLAFVVASGLFQAWRWPGAEQQLQLTLLMDICTITLLMHASGGVPSGLGLLIAISIALSSLLTDGRLALLFAALASLAVLAEQVYAQLSNLFPVTAYTQGGLLGITFFTVAMLAHVLAGRLQETEQLARQQGLDLANLAQLNEYIIQHMTTGVLVVDKDATIRLMNNTAWYLLGRPDAKAGDPLRTRLPRLAKLADAWESDPRSTPGTFRPQVGGRELKPQFAQLGSEQHAGLLIFLEDRAQVMKQAQQMKLASLGQLTASIAHEIRNPLGAISHAGQLLAESPDLSHGDRRLTEIIKNNSQRVNDIIETVLQLSRRSQTHPEYVSLPHWITQFVEEFCRSHMLALERFDLCIEPTGVQVQIDTRQLAQALGNLCDNALKYSGGKADHQTPIRLSGGRIPDSPFPILDVLDNGPGIAPKHVRQIFDPFYTTDAKGTGLGLYIAKELCEINQIDLEYMPGPLGGSCFRLSFRNWRTEAS
jgi:two-component system sensor histidine kinase PilS (NtrC family)